MKRKLYLRFVSAISLVAILSCDSQPEPVGDRVPEGFYPGLRVGTPLSEVRKAYPNLRFQPYYGFVADTPSAPKLFDRFGVQVSTPVSDLPPSMHDRVSTLHLFSNSGSTRIAVERVITQALNRSPRIGCGGKSKLIQVWHWAATSQDFAVLHNPRTADGNELVVMIVSARPMRPESLVTDYAAEPCHQ